MDTVQNNDFNSDILEPSSVTFRIYLQYVGMMSKLGLGPWDLEEESVWPLG
jgi:hypothetical protein